MPKRPEPPDDDSGIDAYFDEELTEEWEAIEDDWFNLDLLDDLVDWMEHEEDWDEDKYGESH